MKKNEQQLSLGILKKDVEFYFWWSNRINMLYWNNYWVELWKSKFNIPPSPEILSLCVCVLHNFYPSQAYTCIFHKCLASIKCMKLYPTGKIYNNISKCYMSKWVDHRSGSNWVTSYQTQAIAEDKLMFIIEKTLMSSYFNQCNNSLHNIINIITIKEDGF